MPSRVLGAGYAPRSSRSCVVCVGAAMPDHGFAPAYKKINYPDRQRRDMSLKSASMISLTTRPLSAPSLEFVDTAPGTRGAGARPRRPATPGSARRAGTICRPSSRPATRTRSSAWAAPGPTPRGGRSRARAASSHSSESAHRNCQRAEISIAQAHARGHELHLLPPAPAPLRRPAARAGLLPPGPRHERPPHLAPRPLSPILGLDGLSPSGHFFISSDEGGDAPFDAPRRARNTRTPSRELTSNPSRRGAGESSTLGDRASRR